MPQLSKGTRRKIAGYLVLLLLTSLLRPITSFFPTYQISSILYSSLLLYWAASVQRRILHPATRRCLVWMLRLMLFLLVIRTSKYLLLKELLQVHLLSWYSYSVSFMGIALFTLLAALSIDEGNDSTLRHARRVLLPLWMLSSALALTNSRHHLVYRFAPGEPDPTSNYTYGPLYWVNTAIIALMLVAALLLVLRKGRQAGPRRKVLLPAFFLLFFAFYYLSFYLNGNVVPDLIIPHLFNPPEALCFSLIGFWEACIQIGLLPSCSSYENLFAISTTGAVILDEAGTVVLSARNAPAGPSPATRNVALHERAIAGGSIRWTTDMTAVNELSDQLDQSVEKLSEENELIAAEINLREKRARLETQNRLYDDVSHAVADQTRRIGDWVSRTEAHDVPEPAFHRELARCCVLGAYVKRRANLEMLCADSEELSADELYFCVRESLEYLRLTGVQVDFTASLSAPDAPEQTLPGDGLIRLYEDFEQIIEAVPSGAAMAVSLLRNEGCSLCLEIHGGGDGPARSAHALPGAKIRQEGDAVFITLRPGKGGEAA